MHLDAAKERFDGLKPEIDRLRPQIQTEADTRLQVIDRILIEVLGWNREDILVEPHVQGDYVDYLLRSNQRNCFVVEAKRPGTPLLDVAKLQAEFYKAGGAALHPALDGLEQAQRYCSKTGVLFSALTTGLQWLGFWAVRIDGRPPLDGKAIAFPSLEAIGERFALFYELFSKDGIKTGLYRVRIEAEEGFQARRAEELESVVQDKDVRLMRQSPLGADLEQVFNGFFGAMSGDGDAEMLAECFVESKESREADVTLSKIADNLLSRIDVVNSAKGEELEREIRRAVESKHGEFVLIIGNKGAGKSTFIDRFFRLVLDKHLLDRCVVLRIDLADSTGELATLVPWLVNHLKTALENQLFHGKSPSYEELQGVFMSEYDRWRHGERKPLYERNRNEFKEKFGDWIATLIDSDPERYVRALLKDVVSARRRMPCIIFDNTDHFPPKFQEAVFQFAQSLHRDVFSFMVCPITDRTVWQLSKAGPFQSYNSRALYLPVPSTKDVLAKRITFVQRKAKGGRGEYFLSKGIRLAIPDVGAFATCVENVFINEDYIGRTVGWLSNHDIRRGLRIANRIITSPVLAVDELVKSVLLSTPRTPRRREIQRALLLGTRTYFTQAENDYILNLFAVEPDSIRSPLLRLSVIRLLVDRAADTSRPEESYVDIGLILNYFESAAISPESLRRDLEELLKYRLVEPYDPTDERTHDEQRLRVTHSGRIHYEFAFAHQEAGFMTQAALRTPVRLGSYLDLARHHLSSHKKMGWDAWKALIRMFVEYLLLEDKRCSALPNIDVFESQHQMRRELARTWDVTSEL